MIMLMNCQMLVGTFCISISHWFLPKCGYPKCCFNCLSVLVWILSSLCL